MAKGESAKQRPFCFAALAPLPSIAGVQERLTNLGYPCIHNGQLDDPTRDALIAFQHDQGLDPTGDADADTLATLRSAHHS